MNLPALSGEDQRLCHVSLQVPAHLQNSWESYYMEILMVTGLLAYIMNYIIGKNKNSRLAQAWFSSHRELLESNFALVGESHRSAMLLVTSKAPLCSPPVTGLCRQVTTVPVRRR